MYISGQLERTLFAHNRFATYVRNTRLKRPAQAEFEEMLETAVNRAFETQSVINVIGEWELVWGPAVFTGYTKRWAETTLYVAKQKEGTGPEFHDGRQRYVIAMAGSNDKSKMNWPIFNLQVAFQKRWSKLSDWRDPPGAPRKVQIALGTSKAFKSQMSNRPTRGRAGAGTTLLQFLADLVSREGDIDIWYCGHSLGGTAGMAIVRYLVDGRHRWDPGSRARLGYHTTASPSSGNPEFAELCTEPWADGTFPDKFARRWRNDLDVAVHAWNPATIDPLPNLYFPDLPADAQVRFAVGLAAGLPVAARYGQPASTLSLKTEFNEHAHVPAGVDDWDWVLTDALAKYITQFHWQHQDKYANEFLFYELGAPGMNQPKFQRNPHLIGVELILRESGDALRRVLKATGASRDRFGKLLDLIDMVVGEEEPLTMELGGALIEVPELVEATETGYRAVIPETVTVLEDPKSVEQDGPTTMRLDTLLEREDEETEEQRKQYDW